MFTNLKELINTMQDESVCREYLAKQRWVDGKAVCPFCGHTKCYSIEKGKRYKCADKTCYGVFSVTTKTIFHASNIPLSKWFMAIYLTSAHKKGISSYQLSRDLGIAQNSAWFMLHRIRKMMQVNDVAQLEDTIEADVTFIGGKITNKSNKVRKQHGEDKSYLDNKTSVLGITQRDGSTIMKVIPKNATGLIDETVKENVKADANIITDEGAVFSSLHKVFNHYTVNHSQNQFVIGKAHTNTIEGVFSHFKRGIYGIYHQITPKHTTSYLDEFTWRFNTRKIKDADRFVLTLQNIERRLTYKTLVSLNPVLAYPKKEKNPRNYSNEKRPVYQIKDDEVIARYDSAWQASVATGISSGNISKVLRNKRNEAGGYKWIFA